MKQFFEDHPQLVNVITTVLCSLLGLGGVGGGMAWHHHKYHGHDHDRPAVEHVKDVKK